jgi:hypothetical protein
MDLGNYVERTLGQKIVLSAARIPGAPLHLEHAYRFWRIRLFGQDFVLAEAAVEMGGGVKRLLADLQALRRLVRGAHVAIVLPRISSTQRQRLIEAGVPFVVPGRQMFLPTVLVDLREHFPRPPIAHRKHLTAAAQFVVLRQILWGDTEGKPLSEVAEDLGYSAMTLTHVRKELVAASVCEDLRRGRAKPLRFREKGRELWEKVRPVLDSPVVNTTSVRTLNPALSALPAGHTALALATMLAARPPTAVALHHKVLRSALDEQLVEAVEDPEQAESIVEAWAYAPRRLARGNAVDPLSLWLSLKDDPDERVQSALEDLLETVSW